MAWNGRSLRSLEWGRGRPGPGGRRVGFAVSSAPDRVSAGSGDRTEGLATIHGEVLNGGLDVGEAPMEDDGERR